MPALKQSMQSRVNIRTDNMNALQVIGNLTIISVFRLIFVQQNYRTVNFYSKNSESEVLNEIIRIVSNSLKPIQLMNIDEINRIERSSYDEPILNILVVSDLGVAEKILNQSILYETTVIWTESQHDYLNDDTPTSWLKISSKVIVLTHSNLYALNNFVETKFHKIGLTNFSFSLTSQFLSKFFSITSIKGSSLTLFTDLSPPKSDLTCIGNNYHLIGPDGIVAEWFAKWLKIKLKFSSNVALKHPNYENFLNGSNLALRMSYQQYYPAIMAENKITIFNHR